MDKLPLVCYFYWENDKMSFLRYMSIKSFIHYNPDFQVVLITKRKKTGQRASIYKEQQDISYFNGKCYWDKCLQLPIKIEYLEEDYPFINKLHLEPQYNSDILTWYILGNKGGIVADTDIIFTNPFDYEKYKDVDVSLFSYYNNFAIGFMFGKPNPIYSDLFSIAYSLKKDNYQSIGGLLIRNYFLMNGNKYDLNVRYIPNEIIYPFVDIMSWKEQLEYPFKKMRRYNVLSDRVCGIHYYGGYEKTKELNQKITKDNYKNFDNLITYHIDKVLTD